MNFFTKRNMFKFCSFTLLILTIFISCNKNNSSENTSKAIKDETKPIISLKGEKEITLSIGDYYQELGALAKDDIDGDLSSQILINILKNDAPVDSIESSQEGEFIIKYTVKDKSGNDATETRKVIVEKSNLVFVKAKSANLRENSDNKAKSILTLSKGTELTFLEDALDTENIPWVKVEYTDNAEKLTGFIKKDLITYDRSELLNEKYRYLDFTPYEKKEYPNNPRVKAKGIYLTIYSAGGQRLDKLIELANKTEINAFVIDVKDDNGYLLFPMKAGEKYSPKANEKNTVKDISALMKKLKDNNIYTIARIVSFKDPLYTEAHPDRAIVFKDSGKPFTNSDNLRWATAYDRVLWEYNVAVAKEAIAAGFNEIQFDYVRFPASNGGKLDASLDYRNVKNETKPQAIQEYLKYARKEISPLGAYISADVYGLVTSVEDDMALGQYWEAVSNVVDYISPMMYPSHYGNGVYGLSVPDAFPYETVFKGTKDGVSRNKNIKTPAIMRPWIQDFTAGWVKGHIKYGDKEVAAQIKAMKDNGVDEYLLWNATNRYSEGGLGK